MALGLRWLAALLVLGSAINGGQNSDTRTLTANHYTGHGGDLRFGALSTTSRPKTTSLSVSATPPAI